MKTFMRHEKKRYFVCCRGLDTCHARIPYELNSPVRGGEMKAEALELRGRLGHHTCRDVVETWTEDQSLPDTVRLEQKLWGSGSALIEQLAKELKDKLKFELKENYCTITPVAPVKSFRCSPLLASILGLPSTERHKGAITGRVDLQAPFMMVALTCAHLNPNISHNNAQSPALATFSMTLDDKGHIDSVENTNPLPLSLPHRDTKDLSFQLISLSAFGVPLCFSQLDIFLSLSHR
jgi:hypothetical protein